VQSKKQKTQPKNNPSKTISRSTREEKLSEKKRTFVAMKNDPAVSKLDEDDGTFGCLDVKAVWYPKGVA
jgi:hypothetical protein